ncbi:MAG: MATE family efflux transporter [Ardenticatenales bacterium]|nr:MATE family efflux transporter [Ardenticatenales bacterium]
MAQGETIVIPILAEKDDSWALRKMVFFLALPAVGEQVLNTLVGLTDQFLVGHLDPAVAAQLGYDRSMALASVGLANLIAWITMTLFMAVAAGATAIVARRIGEGETEQANMALRQALLIALVVGAIGSAFGMLLSEPILLALGAEAQVAAIGASYLRILSLSFIPTALTFAGTAALRGAGDTRSPLYLMVVVNGINVLLAWLLVNGNLGLPGLGVDGSAIGATVARTVAAILLVGLLLAKRMRLKVSWDLRPDGETIRKILKIGAPAAGEQFIFQGAIIIMTAFITGLGTAAMAAHTVTLSIESLSFLPGFGFAIAATTIVGQALGAKDPKLAERASWEALRQGGLMMTLLGLLMAAWPATVIAWFAPDPAVIAHAVGPLRLAGLGQPLLAMAFVLTGSLRGAGDTTWPLLMRVVSTWFVRVPILFALMWWSNWGLMGIWAAMVADFAVQGFLSLWRFQMGAWKQIKL